MGLAFSNLLVKYSRMFGIENLFARQKQQKKANSLLFNAGVTPTGSLILLG
jgi:hypothetical protein